MRVLHLTTSFPQFAGDPSGIFVYQLVEELSRKGVVCGVLTPGSGRRCESFESCRVDRFSYAPRAWQRLAHQPGGIPHALKQTPLLHLLLPGFLTSFAFHIVQMAEKYDLIHAHWSVCGAMAVLTQKLHGKPVVTTLRGSDMYLAGKRTPFAWIQKRSLTQSDFTVGVSKEMFLSLRKQHPALTHRIAFIPNGVGDEFYNIPLNGRPGPPPFRILYVGSLVSNKGVDILLRALAACDCAHLWQLTVAGEGPARADLAQMAQQFELSHRILFLGTVPPSGIPSLMADHHVLVLPSYREGRPNVVLEAMASGLPVIGTEIDGVRELVQPDRTGWLVPPGKPTLLMSLLTSLFRGDLDLASAGKAGREWMIGQGLTWEHTALQYRGAYGSVMNRRNSLKPRVS